MVKWVKLTHVVVVLYSIVNCCKFKHTKHNSTCHLLYACANVPKQPCLMLVTDCWLLVKSFFPLVTGFYTGGVIWKIGNDVFVSRKTASMVFSQCHFLLRENSVNRLCFAGSQDVPTSQGDFTICSNSLERCKVL